MNRPTGVLLRVVLPVTIVAGATLLLLGSRIAPAAILLGSFACLPFLLQAWRYLEGTALRPAVVWAFVALGMGALTEVSALFEPLASGRPLTGHLAYLTTLTTLAALISVLNARTPGGGAWAVLNALLVVVFLIPWLEGTGLGRAGNGLARLRLDTPWNYFYLLLVLAGVTNYLPTRFGPAALWLGIGFVSHFCALRRWVVTPERLANVWTAIPLSLIGAILTATWCARGSSHPGSPTTSLWLWFRDLWGVVWALRVAERFNRSAETLGWAKRLTWPGLTSSTESTAGWTDDDDRAARAVLAGLLRRFATADRLAEEAPSAPNATCQSGEPSRR